MKVGVLQFFSWSRRVPLETVYERALERIAIMDDTGYDAVWLAEHHFNTYSVCPSPTLMATHAAARTKRMRIGTAVTLAGFYQPLRLAEELAMVDMLSGGRLNWGAGRGFDMKEFRAFDVDPADSAERYRESVEIVLKAWRNEKLNHEGKYWRFEDVEVLPKPMQQPNPPFWLASSSPEAIRKSAEAGYNILMDPHSPHAEIGEKQALYHRELAAHGFSSEGRDIPVARLLAIAETDDEAREVARAGAQWTVGSYGQGKRPVSGEEDVDPVQRYVDDVVIHGSPAKVADTIARLRGEMDLEYLMCAPLSHETFMLFTEQVLPKLLS